MRSLLESGSITWNPILKTPSNKIEIIQKSPKIFTVYCKLFEHYPENISYEELLKGFQILSLKNKRILVSLTYLYNILRGKITERKTVEKICIRVPRVESRATRNFHRPSCRPNIHKFNILNRAMDLHNCITNKYADLDVFYLSINKFRKRLPNRNINWIWSLLSERVGWGNAQEMNKSMDWWGEWMEKRECMCAGAYMYMYEYWWCADECVHHTWCNYIQLVEIICFYGWSPP